METAASDIRGVIFRIRSYTPIPFLVLMVIFAEPTAASIAAGLCLVVAGEGIRFWGVAIAGAETRTTGTVGGTYLITNGPFSYVRNPLYVGNMLVYAGVGVMSMALFPWLLVAAIAWFYLQYYLIVTKEEEYLAERFGAEYDEYRRRVWRFLPKPVRYHSTAPPAKSLNASEGLSSERRTLQAIVLVTLLVVGIYVVRHVQP